MVLNPGLGVLGRADGGGWKADRVGSAPTQRPAQAGSAGSASCCGLLPWEAGEELQGRVCRDGQEQGRAKPASCMELLLAQGLHLTPSTPAL